MALKSLTDLRAIIGDPQLLHKWSVDIAVWPSGVPNPPAGVPFMIQTVSEPEAHVLQSEVKLGGYKMQFNGKVDRDGSISFNFVENTVGDVLNYFFIDYANAQQSYVDVNNINLTSLTTPQLLCPQVVLSLYDPTGTTIVKTVTLINVLFKPEKLGIDLDQEVKIQHISVSMSYDSFLIKIL